MATPQDGSDTTLRIEREFAAPPERVFAAWTTPETLTRWFAPTDDYECVVGPFEPYAGGSYRIEMRHRGGAVHVATGRYREVSPCSRLAFTWLWEDRVENGETLVTVTFEPWGAGTRLVLVHERFPDPTARDRHRGGWEACLDRLPRSF